MRVMPIQVFTGASGIKQMKTAFRQNLGYYLREALGLAIFMISACFFSAILFSENGVWYHLIHGEIMKNAAMGIIMGLTALFIFYSPWTAPSGSQINPAVTVTFLRLGKMCRYDALFFVIFQIIGGTLGVYVMQLLMGAVLTDPPVNSGATVPGPRGVWWALVTEFIISLITMIVVLFSSQHRRMKKYTRIFSAVLVCCWVVFAGPVSGFGMNPARSFASALPSGIWTASWIYFLAPFAGMLTAAEIFLLVLRKKNSDKGIRMVFRKMEI